MDWEGVAKIGMGRKIKCIPLLFSFCLAASNVIADPFLNYKVQSAGFYMVEHQTDSIILDPETPLLSHLYVNEDLQYVVGLSSIQSDNFYHFVVWNQKGELLAALPASACTDYLIYPNKNYVFWYRPDDPGIELRFDDAKNIIAVSVNDLLGNRLELPIIVDNEYMMPGPGNVILKWGVVLGFILIAGSIVWHVRRKGPT